MVMVMMMMMMTADAYDTLLLGNANDALDYKRRFFPEFPIVFSGETACSPDAAMRLLYERDDLEPGPLPYINSGSSRSLLADRGGTMPDAHGRVAAGGYIGYIGAIKQMLREVRPLAARPHLYPPYSIIMRGCGGWG
jgi:hypothetical protein